jgi:hypothetical protein
LRYVGGCVGLELFAARFPHVAEAGNFGGGMLSYLAASLSFSSVSLFFDSLRLRLSFRLKADIDDSCGCSTGLGCSMVFDALTEKLGARGPLGLVCVPFRFRSELNRGRM